MLFKVFFTHSPSSLGWALQYSAFISFIVWVIFPAWRGKKKLWVELKPEDKDAAARACWCVRAHGLCVSHVRYVFLGRNLCRVLDIASEVCWCLRVFLRSLGPSGWNEEEGWSYPADVAPVGHIAPTRTRCPNTSVFRRRLLLLMREKTVIIVQNHTYFLGGLWSSSIEAHTRYIGPQKSVI